MGEARGSHRHHAPQPSENLTVTLFWRVLLPRLATSFASKCHKLEVNTAASAREEALEGKPMAGTEEKQHLPNFLYSLELLWEQRWALLLI